MVLDLTLSFGEGRGEASVLDPKDDPIVQKYIQQIIGSKPEVEPEEQPAPGKLYQPSPQQKLIMSKVEEVLNKHGRTIPGRTTSS